MNTYSIPLIDKKPVAEGTMSFYFQKPAGFSHQAGQFIKLNLINPPETDEEGPSRFFTIASAPFEKHLMITTRLRNTAFKRILRNMELNQTIELRGPYGSLTLPEKADKPIVFLSGGIGITPFRSMLLEATHKHLPHNIMLFYANHTPQEAVFLEELQRAEKENPHFKLIAIMTKMPPNEWSGEIEHIDETMLKKYISDITQPIYYIAGPPTMTIALKNVLIECKIDEEQIKYEEFTGY